MQIAAAIWLHKARLPAYKRSVWQIISAGRAARQLALAFASARLNASGISTALLAGAQRPFALLRVQRAGRTEHQQRRVGPLVRLLQIIAHVSITVLAGECFRGCTRTPTTVSSSTPGMLARWDCEAAMRP
jgi:hypothetical protein